jgi:hypothetical protein
MRALLLIIALSFCGYAWSDNSDNHKTITQKNQSTTQKNKDSNLDTSSLEKAIRESIKDAADKTDAHTDEKLESDRKIVEYTGELSFFTKWLAVATIFLAIIAIWQGIQLRRTVDIATKESQPVLSPKVINMDRLHPIMKIPLESNDPILHKSTIYFIFENFGKTPGMIRRVQADLFLMENDKLPEVDWNNLSVHHHQETMPGGIRAKDWDGPAVDFQKDIHFTHQQFKELTNESSKTIKFRRFFLAGIVIYDDFFGTRHTRRFCIKLRFTHGVRFQAQHGGAAYNNFERKKIPKDDPLYKSNV